MNRILTGTGLVFLLVFVLPFISSTIVLDTGLLPRFIVLSFIVLTFVIISFFRQTKTRMVRSMKHPVILIYSLLVVYSLFRISGTYFIGDSLFKWMMMAVYFILFISLYQGINYEVMKKSLPAAMTMLGVVLSIWGFVELMLISSGGKLEIPNSTYAITGCFEHRNLFAQALLLSLPFQLYYFLESEKWKFSILFALTVILNMFMLIVLSNRAVWIASGVVVMLFIVSLFIHKISNSSGLKYPLLFLRILALAISAGLLSYFFLSANADEEAINKHTAEIIEVDSGTVSDRLELWKRSIDLFYEKPIIGHGLANWRIEILKFDNDGLNSEDNITFYQRPHNDYLWILTEEGLTGLGLYLLLYLFILYGIINALFRESDNKNKRFLLALFTAILAYLIYSFFSFPSERVFQNVIMQIFIAAFLIYQIETTETPLVKIPKIAGTIISLISVIILVMAIIAGGYRLLGEYHLKRALEAKNANAYKEIILEAEKATSVFYQISPTSTPLAWYSGYGKFKLNQVEAANISFQAAERLNPYHIHVLNNLGSTWFLLGEDEKAVECYMRAVVVAPNFDESWFNLCAVYYNQKKYLEAYDALIRVNLFTTDKRYKPFIKTVVNKLIKKEINVLLPGKEVPLPEDENWYFEIFIKMRNNNQALKNIIFETGLITQTTSSI